jgi:hypothetical protein
MYSPAVHHAEHVLTSHTSCWTCTYQPYIMLIINSLAIHPADHVLTSRTSCWACTHQPYIMLEMYSPAAHHAGHLQELRPCYRRSPGCRFCALVSWSPPWPGGSERSGGCLLAALPVYIWICYINLACWACRCSVLPATGLFIFIFLTTLCETAYLKLLRKSLTCETCLHLVLMWLEVQILVNLTVYYRLYVSENLDYVPCVCFYFTYLQSLYSINSSSCMRKAKKL